MQFRIKNHRFVNYLMPIEILNIKELSNKAFVKKYAKPGRKSLVGTENHIKNSIKKKKKNYIL